MLEKLATKLLPMKVLSCFRLGVEMNVAETARILNITPSRVSRIMKELESTGALKVSRVIGVSKMYVSGHGYGDYAEVKIYERLLDIGKPTTISELVKLTHLSRWVVRDALEKLGDLVVSKKTIGKIKLYVVDDGGSCSFVDDDIPIRC